MARLMSDGSVVRGDLLEGQHTSHPYLHGDGTLYFAREGLLIAVRDLTIDERIPIGRGWPISRMFHTRVLAGPAGLVATYSAYRPSSRESSSGSIGHVSGLVSVRI
jgi:hypothetical protein